MVAVLCIGSTAGAETVTYQEGANDPFTGSPYEGAEDNMLLWISNSPGHATFNYGTFDVFGAGRAGTSPEKLYRSVLRFDITSLAGEYASIDSVKLRLYVDRGDATSDTHNLQLFRFIAANEGWVEGTKGVGGSGATEAGSSCWNYREYDTTPWDSGTAGTAAADYESGTIAETAFSDVSIGWMELVFTDFSFIGAWAAGNNPGMVLRVEDESVNSKLIFHSAEATDYRPQLVIDYTPGTGPPPIPGDANLDDIVNDADASILAAHWQQTGMGWGDGDFNADNIVNDADASILAAHWQETQEGTAPVPEPSTLIGLLALGLAGLVALRRR